VKIVGVFPADSHPAVTYPVAATASTTKAEVPKYLDFLRSKQARDIFETYGFSVLVKPVS
jgi:molybdate transport system substrate-binding protein